MCDKFGLTEWPTQQQLQAEITACAEHCRVLNNRINSCESKLKKPPRNSKAQIVTDAIRVSLSEFRQRRDIAEQRIDLCRQILDDRQHDRVGSQLHAAGIQA